MLGRGEVITENRNSYNINKYYVSVKNELFDCCVFWAKLINSESENLLTNYTKHTFWEIEYSISGRIGFKTEQNPLMFIEESEFYIVPPDTYHQVVDCDPTSSRFIMGFSISAVDERIAARISKMSVPVSHTAGENMSRLVSVLLKKNYHDTPIRKKIISSLIECLILEILEIVNSVPGSSSIPEKNGNAQLVESIVKYIHEYNGIGLKVTDIAGRFNLSERHLNRITVKETGKSPKEIIDYERMKKVEEMVSATNLSFGEISVLCGFSDEYSMNRFFKKYTNTTLSAFRSISKNDRR